MARLLTQYKDQIASALKDEFSIGNVMAIPKLEKIVISMGTGWAKDEKARFEVAQKQLTLIAGQKPVICLAKKSVSNFKLREGSPVGLKATLRGERMYEFFDRLVSLAIPRVKDFRGLNPSGFDGRGNYNMGLNEQSVFPEIDPVSITFNQGMNICFQTSTNNDEQARALLKALGMPFATSN
ncbi:MAG: 50S ribosomal protein L5 [Phycisphaerales bacterium]|jgi:large subunit ribosomal protein L5|nr:50S ribosomal protein L5 [Phycisphaerales bacterium]MBT7171596.1 50S ribosomal protein L5 [Phycisphaerales bacterium]